MENIANISFVEGSRVKGNPDAIYSELMHIHDRDGYVTPEAVVDFAQDKSTELHQNFTWDDKEAAQQYRMREARHVQASVQVEYMTLPGQKFRALEVVKQQCNTGGNLESRNVYRRVEDIMQDPDCRDQLLRRALGELSSFKKRYSGLSKLSKVFSVIDDALASVGTG